MARPARASTSTRRSACHETLSSTPTPSRRASKLNGQSILASVRSTSRAPAWFSPLQARGQHPPAQVHLLQLMRQDWRPAGATPGDRRHATSRDYNMALRFPFPNDARGYAEHPLHGQAAPQQRGRRQLRDRHGRHGRQRSLLRVDISMQAPPGSQGDSAGTPGMGLSQGLFMAVNDAAVSNAVTRCRQPTRPTRGSTRSTSRSATAPTSPGRRQRPHLRRGNRHPRRRAPRCSTATAPRPSATTLLLADVLVERRDDEPYRGQHPRPTHPQRSGGPCCAGVETTTSTSYVELATPTRSTSTSRRTARCSWTTPRSARSRRHAFQATPALFITDVSSMTANQLKKPPTTPRPSSTKAATASLSTTT